MHPRRQMAQKICAQDIALFVREQDPNHDESQEAKITTVMKSIFFQGSVWIVQRASARRSLQNQRTCCLLHTIYLPRKAFPFLRKTTRVFVCGSKPRVSWRKIWGGMEKKAPQIPKIRNGKLHSLCLVGQTRSHKPSKSAQEGPRIDPEALEMWHREGHKNVC